MGNSNVKSTSGQYGNRPHSVLGVREDDRYTLTDPDEISRYYGSPSHHHPHSSYLSPYHSNHISHHHLPHHHASHHPHLQSPGSPGNHHQERANKISGKAILPPLPRSHSFHQILRPTENGANLIQKGTIRGIDHHAHAHAHLRPHALSTRPSGDLSSESVNPELNAILKERRCRSEADLLDEEGQDDKSNSEKSAEKSMDGIRKGLANGVAARIQRAKYKAPAPPVSNGNQRNDSSNNNSEARSSGLNGEAKQSSSLFIFPEANSQESGRKRNAQSKEKSSSPSTPTEPSKPKLGLIRRLSDKSYFPLCRSSNNNHAKDSSYEVHSLEPSVNQNHQAAPSSPHHRDANFILASRLKGSSSPFISSSRTDLKSSRFLLDSNPEEEMPSLDISHPSYPIDHGNEPSLNEINDFIARELALRSGGLMPNESPNGSNEKDSKGEGRRGGVSKIFRRDKSNGKNSSFNIGSNPSSNGIGKPYEDGSKSKSGQLPPVFDDNFILKRTTPNAGLNQEGKSLIGSPNAGSGVVSAAGGKKSFPLYPAKVNNNVESDKNRYNCEGQILSRNGYNNLLASSQRRINSNSNGYYPQEVHGSENGQQPLEAPDRSMASLSSSTTHQNQANQRQREPAERNQWMMGNNYSRDEINAPISLSSSSSPHLPSPPMSRLPEETSPLSSSNHHLNHHQKNKLDSKESSITRLDSLKNQHLGHSSISDSANYSDEDDEEEIKVVLKPFLPPPRRLLFPEEPIVIADDLFNADDNNSFTLNNNHNGKYHSAHHRSQQCWTPMEDLTSSEDEENPNHLHHHSRRIEEDDDDDGIHCDVQSEEDDPPNGKKDVRDLIKDYNTRFTLKNQLRTIISNNRFRSSQAYP